MSPCPTFHLATPPPVPRIQVVRKLQDASIRTVMVTGECLQHPKSGVGGVMGGGCAVLLLGPTVELESSAEAGSTPSVDDAL